MEKKLKRTDVTIRTDIRPGDIGWITYMHAWIYGKEYRYTTTFEAYVAKSLFDFLMAYNPERDRLWLAEVDGEIVGSIAIVSRGERAQLRWFLLHPDVRGLGLGREMLDNALDYAKKKGFRSVYLDTTSDLDRALDLYARLGFQKVSEKENHSWAGSVLELEMEKMLDAEIF